MLYAATKLFHVDIEGIKLNQIIRIEKTTFIRRIQDSLCKPTFCLYFLLIAKEPKPQKPAEATQKPGKPTAHSFIHDISAIASSSIMEGAMKGAGAKTKKAKVTSTPFNPAAWSEKTRMVADGSYLDLSKNVTVGQHDVIRGLAKKEKEDRDSKMRNSAVTSKGDIST